MTGPKWDFRDISPILRKFRQFLLGRKHELPNLHIRFPPRVSPRSIPQPSIPRGPQELNKYWDQWYLDRNARDSVRPPVVGPLGEGPAYPLDCTKEPQPTNLKPKDVSFSCPPTPGPPWWWDGHCYFECVPDKPKPELKAKSECKPVDPCAKS